MPEMKVARSALTAVQVRVDTPTCTTARTNRLEAAALLSVLTSVVSGAKDGNLSATNAETTPANT